MSYDRGVKLIVTGGHISLTVAFKGPNVILALYKCNYLSVKQELGAATGWKHGVRPDERRWRALCLLPVPYEVVTPLSLVPI